MGNYAKLISVPDTKPLSVTTPGCTTLRYAKNIIPLFWWGAFYDGDLINYKEEAYDDSGTPVHALFREKASALKAFDEFAAGMKSVEGLSAAHLDYLRTLSDQVKKASGEALQLYCCEVEMLLDTQQFLDWVKQGLSFAKLVRAGRLKSWAADLEELLEGSGVYLQQQEAPKQWQAFDKTEFESRVAQIDHIPSVQSESSSVGIFLDSQDWEHSLIGAPSGE